MALSFPLSPTAGDQYVGDGVTYEYDGTLSAWIKLSPVQSALAGAAGKTGAALIPGGDDTERAAITTPAAGMFRYNDQTAPAVMEYYDGAQWVDLATGGGGLGGWQVVSVPIAPSSILYGNGVYMTAGVIPGPGGTSNSIVSSDGGYTWSTPSPLPFSATGAGTAQVFANGNFLANVGFSGQTALSTDGVTWSAPGAVPPEVLAPFAGGGGSYVGIGTTSGTPYYSPDGLNWSVSAGISAGYRARAVAYVGGTNFLALTSNASTDWRLEISTNGGANWSLASTVISASGSTASMVFDGTNVIISLSTGANGYLYKASPAGTGVTSLLTGWPTSQWVSTLPSLSVSVGGAVLAVVGGSNAAAPSNALFSRDSFTTFYASAGNPAFNFSLFGASDDSTYVVPTVINPTNGQQYVAVAKIL